MVTLAEEHALRRKATLNGHAVVTFYNVVVKSNKVDEKIQSVKANREWRVEYMTLLMREQEIAETEREEERKEERKENGTLLIITTVVYYRKNQTKS